MRFLKLKLWASPLRYQLKLCGIWKRKNWTSIWKKITSIRFILVCYTLLKTSNSLISKLSFLTNGPYSRYRFIWEFGLMNWAKILYCDTKSNAEQSQVAFFQLVAWFILQFSYIDWQSIGKIVKFDGVYLQNYTTFFEKAAWIWSEKLQE